MTVQQVIGLALRLVALWLVMQALVVATRGMASSGDGAEWFFYVAAGLHLVLAVFLWVFPMSVAHRLLPRTSHTDKIITNSNQIAVAGVALLGLWGLVTTLPSLFYAVLNASMLAGGGSLFESLTDDGADTVNLMTALFKLVLSCVLLFKARRIARFLTA